MMKKEWSKLSLTFLFLVALMGTLLRSASYISIPFEYANLVHAHSHVAFQGWVYLIMFLLLTKSFLNENQIKKGRYSLQFKLTFFIIIGVMASFSLQGYGLYSIICSTLFQGLNYWFIFKFLKDSKKKEETKKYSIALRFVRTGLLFGLLSTIMPYCIGILSAKGGSGSEAYQSLVYTFLHLQYNGWFLFVVLGLFFHFMDKNEISYSQKHANRFFNLLLLSVIPAIALSLLGMSFSGYLTIIAYVAIVFIGGALIYFLFALPNSFITIIKKKNFWLKLYLYAFIGAFVLKMFLQCLSAFPWFKAYAFYNKFLIIGYLHLSLIGAISFLFLALMIERKWLPLNNFVKTGSALLLAGFITTEILLVLMGLGLYSSQLVLIFGSLAMALGVFLLIISGLNSKKNGTI